MDKKYNGNIGIAVLGADKEAVKELKLTIIAILESGAEQETLRKALDVLGDLGAVKNANISNCSIGNLGS